MSYTNRHDAALRLISLLEKYKNEDCVVLAVPRGGVPVGYHIAKNYNFPMEILLTKKIGHPLNSEVAIGAVGLEDEIIDFYPNISKEYFNKEIQKIRETLMQRYKKFMGDRKPIDLKDKTVIIVDDGIATGNTLLLAIQIIRKKNPKKIVVAVPVSPPDSARKIRNEADELICPIVTNDFHGVGGFYLDFSEVTDGEVLEYMNKRQDTKNGIL